MNRKHVENRMVFSWRVRVVDGLTLDSPPSFFKAGIEVPEFYNCCGQCAGQGHCSVINQCAGCNELIIFVRNDLRLTSRSAENKPPDLAVSLERCRVEVC